MALLYWDGFDCYNSSANMFYANYPRLTTNDPSESHFYTSGGRWNGGMWHSRYRVVFGPGFGFIRYTPASIQTELWMGAAFKHINTETYLDNNVDNQKMFSFNSSGGAEMQLRFDISTNILKVVRPSDGAVLGQTISGDINFGTNGSYIWHYIEVRYKYGESDGAFEVWVDNIRKINLTNIDTVGYGNDNGISSIDWGGDNNCFDIDDIYGLNTIGSAPSNTRLGDLRVYKLNMNSDVGPNNGTPSTGNTRYGVVSDNNLNTFVSIPNGTGNTELYGHTTVPITASSIVSLAVVPQIAKSDAGSAIGHVKISSNNVTSNGASRILLTQTMGYRDFFHTDTESNNWSVTTINNSKIGWEVE